jgi:tRNA-dihydrouridine synthase
MARTVWGGSLENRARLLLDVVRAIREAVPSSFAVAVKLNSADFQRGGFDAEDAARVIAMLEALDVDLVELSGGSYESPAMSGRPADGPTSAREAYFLELAARLAEISPLPLMLTGGITRRETAEQVLASGVALVGMASAMAITPTSAATGRKAVRPPSSLLPSHGLTRRSPLPPAWRSRATRCAASRAVGTPRARRTRSTRSCATSVRNDARSAATVRGWRPEHEV